MVDHVEVRVPVMVNDKDVKKGEELVVFWVPETTKKRKPQASRKSWLDAAEAEVRTRRKSAAPAKAGTGAVGSAA